MVRMTEAEFAALMGRSEADAPKEPRRKHEHPERDLQDAVIACAKLHGWKVHYRPDWQWMIVQEHVRKLPLFRRARLTWSDNGFPDLVLSHPARQRVLYAELKAGKNAPSDGQRDWMQTLADAGQEVFVWTDKAWQSGEIERILSGEEPA